MPTNATTPAAAELGPVNLPVRIHSGDRNLIVDADGDLVNVHAIIADLNAMPRRDKLVAALGTLLFSAVSNEHGMQVADALEQNHWVWPDDAPRFINLGHEQARAALATAKVMSDAD